jgi:Acetyltransferase (GNAT) domain
MTSALTSVVAKSVAEMQAFRDVWQRWQDHPDNDIDNFLLLLKGRKEIFRPHVMLFSRGDQPVTLVTGRVERSRVNFTVGYKNIPGPAVNSLTVPYGGILGTLDDEIARLILAALSNEFGSDHVDRITFNYLPESSPLMNALQNVRGRHLRLFQGDWTPHFMANLSSDVDVFWAKLSRQHRNFLRRKARKLEQETAQKIEYSRVTEEADVEKLCAELEEVAKKTYLRGLGKGFIWDAPHVERMMMAARNQRLRAFLLRIGGKPISYVVGPVYNGKFNLAYTAYDPAYGHYDVGQLVLVYAIESLCREGQQYFDFGFGAARYKEQFGDKCVRERSVSWYAPTVKAAALTTAVKMNGFGTRVTRACFSEGVVKLLKRYWRKRLAQGSNGKPKADAQVPAENS